MIEKIILDYDTIAQIEKITDKLNETIEVVNKAHTCDCHRCPSEDK